MKFKFKPTRRKLIALVAIILLAGAGVIVLLDALFANQMTPARAVGKLEKASPVLVRVLKDDFSEDFGRIVAATVKSGSDLAGNTKVASFLNEQTRPLIARYGVMARRAPQELISDWMRKLAAVMDEVQKVAGPDLCSRYVNEGKSVLTDPDMVSSLLPAFDARDAALFEALAGARDAPESAGAQEATQADWAAVEAAMNGFEVPSGYAQIVSADNTNSPDYCPALAYYFRTVAARPDDIGQRVRAEHFARSLS